MDVALAGKATMEKVSALHHRVARSSCHNHLPSLAALQSGSEAQQQMQELKKANATLRQRLQEEEAELAKTKQNLSAFQHKVG